MLIEFMTVGLRHTEYKPGCSPTVKEIAEGYRFMLTAAPEARSEECVWARGDDIYWHTGCGTQFYFTTMDGPTENGMHYCHSCGKRLREGGES